MTTDKPEATTLDRLYLEWSQFTPARNFRERDARETYRLVRRYIAEGVPGYTQEDILRAIDARIAELEA